MHPIAHTSWLFLAYTVLSAEGITEYEQRPIQSSSEHHPFDPSFDKFVDSTLRELHIPGLSIAVVDGGKITSKGFGFSTLPDQKATADTQYFTASTTKAFTAALAALLVHDDVEYPSVKWTTPISQLIRSDFVLEHVYATSHTTIEDALSHRTGLPRHDLIVGLADDTPSKVVQRMRYLPLTAEPRTRWQYSNLMYAVITDLIQTVTRMDFETLLRNRIWSPLGMRSTTLMLPSDKVQRSRLARGYYWSPQNDDGEYVPDIYLDLLTTAGDGAIISTVNDYALWIKTLLNAAGDDESWNSSSPLTSSIYHDLMTPRAILPEAEDQQNPTILSPPLYALGWITAVIRDISIVTHAGGITGFGTQVLMMPGHNYGVVTMGNTAGSSNDAGAIIASKLVAEKLGLAPEHTDSASSMQQSLVEVQRAAQRSLTPRHRARRPSSGLDRAHTSIERLPLPLASFAGMYSHAAYGTVNLTIDTSKTASPTEPVLEALFYRTTILKQVLTHVSGTLFKSTSFEPHGLGDIITGDGIVWEKVDDDGHEAYASFELGIDGESVERVGMELEPEIVDLARGKGRRYWKEGMIWFDKA